MNAPRDLVAINGRIEDAATASISVFDLGFLRATAVFDTLRTYGGHPFALAEHVDRLWTSAAAIGVDPLFTTAELRALLARMQADSGHDELQINMVVSPGRNVSGLFGAADPTWVVIARGLKPYPRAHYRDGIAVITFEAERHLPTVKSTNYLIGRTGIAEAQRQGAAEALYIDKQGLVTEGVTSNVLILTGDTIRTPAEDCLPGITKAHLQRIALAQGLDWEDAPLRPQDLHEADEVWISSSVRELMPVVRVDDIVIQDGKPGPWAVDLHQAFRDHCRACALAEARAAYE